MGLYYCHQVEFGQVRTVNRFQQQTLKRQLFIQNLPNDQREHLGDSVELDTELSLKNCGSRRFRALSSGLVYSLT